MSNEEKMKAYLADIGRLQKIKDKCPHVSQEFLLEVVTMDREELQRRVLIQADHIGHYASCLDGIKEIRNIPGGSLDGHRDKTAIRNTVLMLLQECPTTWENTFQGERKHPRSKRETELLEVCEQMLFYLEKTPVNAPQVDPLIQLREDHFKRWSSVIAKSKTETPWDAFHGEELVCSVCKLPFKRKVFPSQPVPQTPNSPPSGTRATGGVCD